MLHTTSETLCRNLPRRDRAGGGEGDAGMKHLGDIKQVHDAPFVDCITFGSPCQDLSVAGKRAGLVGERSGLFMEAVRIIKEMRTKSNGVYPTFAVWENVPGAFSSNGGEDFRSVLEELARIQETGVSIPRPERGKWAKAGFICGDGWSLAWRTLDAQYWGVPQRRRRIALVVDFGGQRAGEILFERKGMLGHLEPRIPPWKGVARNPENSIGGHNRMVEGAGFNGYKSVTGSIQYQTETAATLESNMPGNVIHPVYPDTARALTARHDGSPCADRGPNAVCCAAFTAGQGTKANGIGWAEEQAPTLRTDGGLSAMPTVLCRAQSNTNAETYDNLSPTLTVCHDGPPIVFESHTERYAPDVSKALRAKANCSFREDAETFVAEKHIRWIVRRLTPKECERLQGYPDGWTDIGEWTDSKGKRHKPADSPRYKALGNSIALPQWWWLTCKMAEHLPAHATLGSLFDGIGGFPLVWETYHGKGTALWASEIEEFPIAVTRRRFSDAQ